MKFTKNQQVVLVLLLLATVFGFALTPLGFETRTPDLRSWAIVPFFVAASLGIPILALLILYKRPARAGKLVVLNAIVMLFLVPGDQAGFFFTTPVPPVITAFEFLSVIVSIGFLLWGPKLYSEAAKK